MKDENRKFQTCIFCETPLTGGKTGTRSREHIFGKSIAKALSFDDHWSAPSHFLISKIDHFDPGPSKTGSSPLLNMTSRSVCRSCNSGPLGENLSKVKSIVLDLVSGKRENLPVDIQKDLALFLSRIAAIVDVETSNFELGLSNQDLLEYASKFGALRCFPPSISLEERKQLAHGKMPESVNVLIGKHIGYLGETLEFCVADGGSLESLRQKTICFAIDKLVVIMEIRGIFSTPPQSLVSLPTNNELKWPLPQKVSYDDFYSFHVQSPDIIWTRACLSDKRTRNVILAHYKKTGKVIFPKPPVMMRRR